MTRREVGTSRSQFGDLAVQLASRDCLPCKDIPPMSKKEAQRYLTFLPAWTLIENKIEKEYRFRTYLEGLDFANPIGHIDDMSYQISIISGPLAHPLC